MRKRCKVASIEVMSVRYASADLRAVGGGLRVAAALQTSNTTIPVTVNRNIEDLIPLQSSFAPCTKDNQTQVNTTIRSEAALHSHPQT